MITYPEGYPNAKLGTAGTGPDGQLSLPNLLPNLWLALLGQSGQSYVPNPYLNCHHQSAAVAVHIPTRQSLSHVSQAS